MLPMHWENGEKAKKDLDFPTNCFLELYNNLNKISISWFSVLDFFFYRSKQWWLSGLQDYKLCLAITEVELLIPIMWTSVTRWLKGISVLSLQDKNLHSLRFCPAIQCFGEVFMYIWYTYVQNKETNIWFQYSYEIIKWCCYHWTGVTKRSVKIPPRL